MGKCRKQIDWKSEKVSFGSKNVRRLLQPEIVSKTVLCKTLSIIHEIFPYRPTARQCSGIKNYVVFVGYWRLIYYRPGIMTRKFPKVTWAYIFAAFLSAPHNHSFIRLSRPRCVHFAEWERGFGSRKRVEMKDCVCVRMVGMLRL